MKISYITPEEAINLHIEFMKSFGETRCGLNNREMLESALARPHNSANYENGDIIRQTASLYFGLVKNRIWHGGNNRTATVLIKRFLETNGFQTNWTLEEIMQLGRNVDTDVWNVDEIENWLGNRTKEVMEK